MVFHNILRNLVRFRCNLACFQMRSTCILYIIRSVNVRKRKHEFINFVVLVGHTRVSANRKTSIIGSIYKKSLSMYKIYIVMGTIRGIVLRWKFVCCINYYNEYFTLGGSQSFTYMHSVHYIA